MYHFELYRTFTFSNAYPKCPKHNEDSDQMFDILIIVTKSTFRSIKRSLNQEKAKMHQVCMVFENTDSGYIVHPTELYKAIQNRISPFKFFGIKSILESSRRSTQYRAKHKIRDKFGQNDDDFKFFTGMYFWLLG